MIPTSAEAFFDAIAGRYERSYALPSVESRRRMDRVLASLPPAPARILDLGVGTGRELSALLDAGHVVTGVDVSREMLERCRRRARPVPLVHADFWRGTLPFERDAFDAAIALHGALAHPSDEQAFRRLSADAARIVRRGGVFLAEIPSPALLEDLDAISAEDRRFRRTSWNSCVFEDVVAGASIEVTLMDELSWRAALAPEWNARVESVERLEWLVVARRI